MKNGLTLIVGGIVMVVGIITGAVLGEMMYAVIGLAGGVAVIVLS